MIGMLQKMQSKYFEPATKYFGCTIVAVWSIINAAVEKQQPKNKRLFILHILCVI